MIDNFGNIIYINRIDQKLSIRELEEITGIPHEKISRFERGTELPKREDIEKILEALHIELSEENDTKSLEYYNSFLREQFLQTIDNKKTLEKLKYYKHIFFHSSYGHLYFLIQLMCKLLLNNNSTDKEEKILNRTKLKSSESQVYTQCLAIKKDNEGLYEESLKLYKESLRIRDNKIQDAMIYYQMSMTLAALNRLHEAKESLEIARDYFYSHGSLVRLTYCHMQLGNIYTKDGQFKKALECYQNALDNYKFIEDKYSVIPSIKRNMIWVYICLGRYNEALELLEEQEDKTLPNVIYLYCCCYVKLKDLKNLEIWLKEGKKYIKDDYINEQYMMLYRYMMKNDNSARAYNKAKQVYKNLEKTSTYEQKIFLLDLIIDILEAREDYIEQNKYLKMKINLVFEKEVW